jgi:hypothetical protein
VGGRAGQQASIFKVRLGLGEKEWRDREKERQRDRETERQRDRETER